MRCNRLIDASARSCVYCNWWQADAPPPRPEPVAAQVTPPKPEGWRKYIPAGWNTKVLGVVAFVALLILAFVIGSLIHGFEPSDVRAAQQEAAKKQGFKTDTQPPSTAPAPPPPRSNVELVPDNGAPSGPGEAPITSAPSTTANGLPGAMSETQRDDATALPSEQYAVAAQRARAEQQQQQSQSVDPRSITGTAYQQGQPGQPARPRRVAQRARMTQPVAVSQPVPELHGRGHARLALIVGTDGRVHAIDVIQPFQGDMGRLIGAVQTWRFRPATENGIPVASRFTVDINVE